jgi:hypothetical protein
MGVKEYIMDKMSKILEDLRVGKITLNEDRWESDITLDMIQDVVKLLNIDKVVGQDIKLVVTKVGFYIKIRVYDIDKKQIDIKYIGRLIQNLRAKGITEIQNFIQGSNYTGGFYVVIETLTKTLVFKDWELPTENENMLDIQAARYERYTCGFVSIEFKGDDNKLSPWFAEAVYVLNGTGDGWFRRIEGRGKGIGLMIRDIKLTSPKAKRVGDFNAYNVKIKYAVDEEGNMDEGLAWLSIHQRFYLDDVLSYIKKHMSSWKP